MAGQNKVFLMATVFAVCVGLLFVEHGLRSSQAETMPRNRLESRPLPTSVQDIAVEVVSLATNVDEVGNPKAVPRNPRFTPAATPAVSAGPKKFPMAQCATTFGDLTIEFRPDWAPHGAERMRELVAMGFFSNMSMFRVPPLGSNPIAQFGAAHTRKLRDALGKLLKIPDDFPTKSPTVPWNDATNRIAQLKGHFGYGGSGNNSRTHHMWVARTDFKKISDRLGGNIWDVSVARIVNQDGIDAMDRIEVVGDMAPWGNGPDTGKMLGDPTFDSDFPGDYIRKNFPKMDYFKWCKLI